MTKNTKDQPLKNNPVITQDTPHTQPPQTIPFKEDSDSENTAITENTDGRRSKNPDIKNPADEQQFEQEHESESNA